MAINPKKLMAMFCKQHVSLVEAELIKIRNLLPEEYNSVINELIADNLKKLTLSSKGKLGKKDGVAHCNPWNFYLKGNLSSLDCPQKEKFGVLSARWNALSKEEQAPYHEMSRKNNLKADEAKEENIQEDSTTEDSNSVEVDSIAVDIVENDYEGEGSEVDAAETSETEVSVAKKVVTNKKKNANKMK